MDDSIKATFFNEEFNGNLGAYFVELFSRIETMERHTNDTKRLQHELMNRMNFVYHKMDRHLKQQDEKILSQNKKIRSILMVTMFSFTMLFMLAAQSAPLDFLKLLEILNKVF